MTRKASVAFADASLKAAFETIESGKYEERELATFIRRAIRDLEANPLCGVRVPSRLWPKEYVRKYAIDNLRKYDLPNGWRLIYTIHGNEVEILSVLLEWLSHKDYEKRFHYAVK
jgi:Txe/YoeB family toxin of Txe-Axe toxin-antitoxin module